MKRFVIIALLVLACSDSADAGLLSRLFARRSSQASVCGPNGCAVQRPAAAAKSQVPSCYTLPNGVRVCPVK